jgi:hypothetical protein
VVFGNFAKIGRAAGASFLAKAQSCQTFNQNLVLLFVFSFSSFVKAKFGAFVRIFIVSQGQFHFTFVFIIHFRHFDCFGKIINCTAAVQLIK